MFEDEAFSESRKCLDAAMRERSSEGLGAANKKQTEVISSEEEELLWKTWDLGDKTSRQLLDTIMYFTGLHFALRGGREHRQLRLLQNPQITGPHKDHSGRKYLLYSEDGSKTNPGGLKNREQVPKQVRAYENVLDPDRCFVRLYQKYTSVCPKNAKGDVFYFTPRQTPKDEIWFVDKPVGHNTLQATIKRLFIGCGIQGKSNHSLRATAATRLYQEGVDEQMICEITGHRSEAVRSYKRTSDQQKSAVSAIICGADPKRRCKTISDESEKPTPTQSPVKSTSSPVTPDESTRSGRPIVFNVHIA